MALRDVLSRAAEAVRPRNWTDHASTLEARLAGLQAERVAVESSLQRAAASAFADSENSALTTEQNTLAKRLSDIERDLALTDRALSGARLRLADEQNTEATAARKAKRERVTEIYAEIHSAAARMDLTINTLAADAEKIQALREELAGVTSAEVAAAIGTGAFSTLAGHRLSAMGFNRSFAFNAADKPQLIATLPELNYVLKLARLN